MTAPSVVKKSVAAGLCLALILLSPGLEPYAAFAGPTSNSGSHYNLPHGASNARFTLARPDAAAAGHAVRSFSSWFLSRPGIVARYGDERSAALAVSAAHQIETFAKQTNQDVLVEWNSEQQVLELRTAIDAAAALPSYRVDPARAAQTLSKEQSAQAKELETVLAGARSRGEDAAQAIARYLDQSAARSADSTDAATGQETATTKPAAAALARNDSRSRASADATRAPAEPSAPATQGQTAEKPSRLAAWMSRLKNSLNMSSYTPSQKAYLLGQTIFFLSLTIYLTSLPLLVKAITGDAAHMGTARMIHYWTLGITSLFAGHVAAANPMKRVLVLTGIGRGVVFGAIAIAALAVSGPQAWPIVIWLIGVNAFLVAHNHLVDADTGGLAKVFPNKQQREKAFYFYTMMSYGMLLVMPWIWGFGFDLLDKAFGFGVGPKAGFLLLALGMGITTWIYAAKVDFGDPKVDWATRWSALKNRIAQIAAAANAYAKRAKGVIPELADRILLDVVWIVTSPREEVRLGWQRFVSPILEPFATFLGKGKLVIRTVTWTAESFLDDALFFVALSVFAVEILKVANLGNGILVSAANLGGLLASMLLVKKARFIEDKLGEYRFISALSILAAFAFVPSIGLWMFPSLLVAIPLVTALKLMTVPIKAKMGSWLQHAMEEDAWAKKRSDMLFSWMTSVSVFAAGGGGKLFEEIFLHSGPDSALTKVLGANAPMKVVTLSLMAFSAMYLGILPFLKKQILQPVVLAPADESKLPEATAKLAASLARMGLPAYREVNDETPADDRRPTVVFLAPGSVHKLAILREGARQAPGDVHLALDRSWLIRKKSIDGKAHLYLSKGLTFDGQGNAVIVMYTHPRAVHYFANFHTLGANDRDDGVPLEEGLATPMSSSLQLETVVNDKLWTRLLLAAKGVAVPATAAFLMAANPLLSKALPSLGTVTATPMTQDRAAIRRQLEQFLNRYPGAEVVVKPSGPQFHSGRGVNFFNRDQLEPMIDHVLELAKDKQMTQDGAVLVDGRLTPPAVYLRSTEQGARRIWGGKLTPIHPLKRSEIASAAAKEKKDWNLRVLVGRTPWNGARTMEIFARAGAWGIATTAETPDPRDSAVILPLEDVIVLLQEQHGLLHTPEEVADFKARLNKVGEDAMQAIITDEAKRVRQPGEPWNAQTDMIGLDVMIEVKDGKIVPHVIEVNDHDSGGQFEMDAYHPERSGQHSRAWLASALERARLDALNGKRIVVIGAGPETKRFFFERAKELGVQVILLDKGGATRIQRLIGLLLKPFGYKVNDHWARELVSEFIEFDSSRPDALTQAQKLVAANAAKSGKIEGVAPFWEDDVLLSVQLAHELGLPSHTVEGAKAARDKALFYEVMKRHGLPSARYRLLNSAADVEAAAQEVGFPSLIKPVAGSGALLQAHVYNSREALEQYATIRSKLTPELDTIFAHDRRIIMVEDLFARANAREFDVDVPMQNGQALGASVSYNWPTRKPYPVATGSSTPGDSHFSAAENKRIIDVAVASAKAQGLTHGVVHLEGIYSDEGPVMIDNNGRLGGAETPERVAAVWGVDLVDQQLFLAAGIEARPGWSPAPLTHLEGEFITLTEPGIFSSISLPQNAREGLQKLIVMKQPGAKIEPPYNARLAMLVARGESAQQARENLVRLRAALKIETRPLSEPKR